MRALEDIIILKAPEWLHGRKILGPKAIDEYNLFFGHSGVNLNISIFTIAIINKIITIIYFFILIHPSFDSF